MIPVPLVAFLRDGAFGPIRHTMDRTALEAILGPIPDWDACRSGRHFTLLKFGDVELHLEHDRLYLVFLHPSAAPDGGDRFDLSDWFLGGAMTRTQVEAALIERGLLFDSKGLIIRLPSSVELCFDTDAPAEPLAAIQWMRRR